MKENLAILIPAYNPTNILVELVENLKKSGYTKIIVVNDGSKKEDIFKKIEKKVILLKHDKNLGKGKALKTGLDYCLNNVENIIGVITVDADGQHLIKDINNLYNKILTKPKSLIIGSREFKKENTPFRSLLGNKIIRFIFEQKTNVKINDTQTGLRAIPYIYLSNFIKIKGERFEYETHMLLYAIKQNIEIIEQKIELVYIDNNKTSNFQVIKDSIKIIKTVLKGY